MAATVGIGDRFGKWTVLALVGRNYRGSKIYRCRCDCGTERNVRHQKLIETSRSCGCSRTIFGIDKKAKTVGAYRSWVNMMRRCHDRKCAAYPLYGGRGITVCERWHDFAHFYADVGDRPPKTSLGRIDVNKGYEPSNVRWETNVQQMNNTRRNRVVTYAGRSLTVTEWGRELGMNPWTIKNRLNRGWSPERALNEPVR